MFYRRATLAFAAVLAASVGFAADAPKLKVELVLDTPDHALKTYMTAWQVVDYNSIMATIVVTDAKKKPLVERYVNYMMWCDALERTAAKKWGDDEAMKVLSHVRTLEKQLDLDIKKRIINANVTYNSDKTTARVMLRQESNRPENLKTDNLSFLDEFHMTKSGNDWKLDFLKTYELNDSEKEQEYNYYANSAYPVLIKKMKTLAEGISSGKINSASDAAAELASTWQNLPGAANTDPNADPSATNPAEK